MLLPNLYINLHKIWEFIEIINHHNNSNRVPDYLLTAMWKTVIKTISGEYPNISEDGLPMCIKRRFLTACLQEEFHLWYSDTEFLCSISLLPPFLWREFCLRCRSDNELPCSYCILKILLTIVGETSQVSTFKRRLSRMYLLEISIGGCRLSPCCTKIFFKSYTTSSKLCNSFIES